jgi:hypothetical protein
VIRYRRWRRLRIGGRWRRKVTRRGIVVVPGDRANDIADRTRVIVVGRNETAGAEKKLRCGVGRCEGRPDQRISDAGHGSKGKQTAIRPEAGAKSKKLRMGEVEGHEAHGTGKGAAEQPPALLLRPP